MSLRVGGHTKQIALVCVKIVHEIYSQQLRDCSHEAFQHMPKKTTAPVYNCSILTSVSNCSALFSDFHYNNSVRLCG